MVLEKDDLQHRTYSPLDFTSNAIMRMVDMGWFQLATMCHSYNLIYIWEKQLLRSIIMNFSLDVMQGSKHLRIVLIS